MRITSLSAKLRAGCVATVIGLGASAAWAVDVPMLESVQAGYGDIAEDQAFILRFNQDIQLQDVLPYSYCQSSALGEQIPLVAVEPLAAQTVLTEHSYDYTPETANQFAVVTCAQRLAAGSTVRIHLQDRQHRNRVPKAFVDDQEGLAFTVRSPLRAQLVCEKTKSTADCNPLRPIAVHFSAPVAAALVQQLQLLTPDNQRLPQIMDSDASPATDTFVESVRFEAPKLGQTQLRWQLPAKWAQLKDDAGRSLANPQFFQAPVITAPFPPLLKFPHEGIGVLEHSADNPALLPLAIRSVDAHGGHDSAAESAGTVQQLRLTAPKDMFDWYVRVKNHHASDKSLFTTAPQSTGKQSLQLPAAPLSTDQAIELIGVPLEGTGLHVLEAQSAPLGNTYHNDAATMYVNTAALVTNLAVHSKLAQDQLLVWVSTLDTAQPVANAKINVLRCDGVEVASGVTDAQGKWLREQPFEDTYCSDTGLSGLFIVATEGDDRSFVLSHADQGIETWRFNLPYFYGAEPSEILHTVTDRPLYLAGETVHLKHYWRGQAPAEQELNQAINQVVIRHAGSGDEITQPLQWQRSPSGGWYALSTLELAKNMTLGQYEVWLQGAQRDTHSASFYIEAFKRPYLTGKLNATTEQGGALVAAKRALVDMQFNYISGGVAAELPVNITALTQNSTPYFAEYDEYQFHTASTELTRPHVVVDKTALQLDQQGAAQLPITLVPSASVQDLVVEASFMDPSGQIQSVQQRQTLWPAQVVVGVQHSYWEQGDRATIKGVVLTPEGQPVSEQKVELSAQKQHYYTTRQRMVGGFYRYDSVEQLEEVGTVCQTQTDAKGTWQCEIHIPDGGQIMLHSHSKDKHGQTYTTETSLWLGGEAQATAGANHDRMDVLADQKNVEPGQTVRFHAAIPFAQATALIAVEQDRILHTEVVTLTREQPFFDLTVRDDWGPNVYVSVLALRGRVYPATWQSFLDGGWRSPIDWYKAYQANKEVAPAPTHSIDLAKPSFRYGIAQLAVANKAHTLNVQLTPHQSVYQVGETAQLQLQATLADSQPAAQASVLVVGVDQALLELMENSSWDLLDAMYPPVGYGIRTATMQSEVIGRRHYGRKAVAAGGGGGGAPTREILDSLLVWLPEVVLDEQGRAVIDVPLNHSITQFELVALADYAGSQFGVAKTQIQTHQPIQIMSGLPAVVRTGDAYEAVFSVRNRESNAVTIAVEAEAGIDGKSVLTLSLGSQQIPAQSSQRFTGTVTMPLQLGLNEGVLQWTVRAMNTATDTVVDAVQFTQQWQAHVPVTTLYADWRRLVADQPQTLAFSLPTGALSYDDRPLGQLTLAVHNQLGDQSAVTAWFEQYAYTCFEQQASKFVALHDAERWQALMHELPSYLDKNQLLRYFPSPYLSGSAGLTAYVLSLSAYAPDNLKLPSGIAQRLQEGLHDYIQGRRDQPRTDAIEQVAFYLAALDAVSHYGNVPAERLDSVALAPKHWPTSALIDGLRIVINAEQRDQIEQALQERLVKRGTAWQFSADNPLNSMPALMVSPVTNQARLLLAVADRPEWQPYVPALVHGLLAQQQQGRWGTTTENSWALLALEKVNAPASMPTQIEYTVANQAPVQASVPFETQWEWQQNGPVHIVQVAPSDEAAAWVQLRAEAAVPVSQPVFDGYTIERQVTAVEQAQAGQWQVGDSYEVTLRIQAEHSSVWAVINDAIPAGAMVIDQYNAETDNEIHPSYVERLFTGYRAYIEFLPAGTSVLRYRVRLNTAGQFDLPPTTVEALYDASVQAQLPVEAMHVHSAP